MPHSITSSLQAVNVAAITPRAPDGDINFGATFELIDYLCAAKVGGIALFTTWGEYAAHTVDERARLTYLAVKRSRVPVLVGVGSATFDQSLALAREARSAGVAAVLVPPPMFYPYGQDDLEEFYGQFAAQLGEGVPLLLSGHIAPRTAARLMEGGKFAGVEDLTGNLNSLDGLCAAIPGATVLAGHDRLFVHALCARLGVVSAAACAAPELCVALHQAITKNAPSTAELEACFRQLVEWLDRLPPPVGVKTAVGVRGIKTGPLSIPLTAEKQERLDDFREWFQGWLPASRKLATRV